MLAVWNGGRQKAGVSFLNGNCSPPPLHPSQPSSRPPRDWGEWSILADVANLVNVHSLKVCLQQCCGIMVHSGSHYCGQFLRQPKGKSVFDLSKNIIIVLLFGLGRYAFHLSLYIWRALIILLSLASPPIKNVLLAPFRNTKYLNLWFCMVISP